MALARLATHDRVDATTLGAMLDGIAPADPAVVRALVETRTARP